MTLNCPQIRGFAPAERADPLLLFLNVING